MLTWPPSKDTNPALSLIRAPRALAPRTLPADEQRLLEATLKALADSKAAPDAIVAGFKEELAELRAKRVA